MPSPQRTLAALAGLALLARTCAAAGAGPLVAVAANMTGAATEIAAQFADHTGIEARLSFGASGNLARQILRGAPFEVFVSADAGYPSRLQEGGRVAQGPAAYATGRLVLYLSAGFAPAAPAARDESVRIRDVLSDPHLARLAIANPEHAPYGRAARQVLERLDLWPRFQGHLVVGESVSQAARFVRTSEVQAAMLPLAMALEPVLAGGRRLLIPAAWHEPLHQHAVVLTGAGPEARRFFAFLLGAEARAVLLRRGYDPPRD